jgi:hypothetical protein
MRFALLQRRVLDDEHDVHGERGLWIVCNAMTERCVLVPDRGLVTLMEEIFPLIISLD